MNHFRPKNWTQWRSVALTAALAALAACGDNIALDYPDGKPSTGADVPDSTGPDTKADTTNQDAADAQTDAVGTETSVGSDIAAAECGDGKREGTEACDDGDTIPGDGCSNQCAVEAGYSCTQASPSVCTDIDECTANTDDCSANANCTNTPGSFTCACKPGYEGNGKTCTDINECTANTDDCGANATCTNTDGAFTCACDSGYVGDGKACSEVNPCEPGTFTCPSNSVCNKTGLNAYECICDAGYTKEGGLCVDINECDTNADNCDLAADCSNTVGSFACACKPGYDGDGTSCTDVDECALDTDGCDLAADCTNTIGSFGCDCKPGFEGNGFACTDIDECTADTDNCDLAADCSNTVGSFACACKPGYDGNGTSCTDIDECTTGANNCAAVGSKCSNTPGSFSCACLAGYVGDGTSCTDIDECAPNDRVGAIASLPWEISNTSSVAGWQIKDGALVYSNFDGSVGYGEGENSMGTARITIPLAGVNLNYPFSLEIVGMADIETDTMADDVYGVFYVGDVALGAVGKTEWFNPATGAIAFQVNNDIDLSGLPSEITSVAFEFVFATGDDAANSGAGVKFTDFRFRQKTYNCLPEAESCTNTPGSYTCQCPTGYAGDGITACSDVDECTAGLDACDIAAACTNTEGSYQCFCGFGYEGDGFKCTDIDECTQNTDACDMAADCSNTVGSYTCTCPAGYTGNGYLCEDINECNDFWITTPQLITDLSWEISNTSETVGWHLDGAALAYSATDTTGYATGDQPNAGTARVALAVPAWDANRELALHIEAQLDIDPSDLADALTMTITANTGETLIADKSMILGLSFNGTLYIDAPLGLAQEVTSLVVEFAFDTVTPVTVERTGLRITSLYLKHEIDNCSDNGFCNNLTNDFTCECAPGYQGNGVTCDNVNECTTVGLSDCVTNATCTDFDGGYSCDCDPGYVGDGKVSCTEPEFCGNGFCGVGEDSFNCNTDCGPPPPVCGDTFCEGIEIVTCPTDCGPPPPICGDTFCDGMEVVTCPSDCGPPGPVCGDTFCEPFEVMSCPADCGGGPPPIDCGNAICDQDEDVFGSPAYCPQDCPI